MGITSYFLLRLDSLFGAQVPAAARLRAADAGRDDARCAAAYRPAESAPGARAADADGDDAHGADRDDAHGAGGTPGGKDTIE